MDYSGLREKMVQDQIESRGIANAQVLRAMRTVPRHLFVPEEFQNRAYEDRALSIGQGQTISQPYMVATMLQAAGLVGEENVLEIGTGSGYQAALLSYLAETVHTIEILPSLAESAGGLLKTYPNVSVHLGDGSTGFLHHAPFDMIIVAAATPKVPDAWLAQLRDGGQLLVPIGKGSREILTRMKRRGELWETQALGDCAFVPLTGMAGITQ